MEIIEELERDEKLRKRLIKLIASEILLDPELKLLLVEKASKPLQQRCGGKAQELCRCEFDALNKRIDDMNKPSF